MRKKTTRSTLLLISVTAGLLILTFFSSILSYNAVYNESISALRQQNRALANHLNGWLSVKINQTENQACIVRNDDKDLVTSINHFIDTRDRMDGVSLSFVGLPDGRVASSNGWDYTTNAPERPWYMLARDNPGEVMFTRPYVGLVTGIFVFSSVRTVSDYDASLGVTGLSLPFHNVTNYVLHDEEVTDGYSFILDRDGTILFHPDDYFVALDGHILENITEIINGRYASMFYAVKKDGFYVGTGRAFVGVEIEATDWLLITSVAMSHIWGRVMPTIISVIVSGLIAITMLVGSVTMVRNIRASRSADAENEAKTRFLARMSHEMRTPMNAVMGITEIEMQKDTHPAHTTDAFRKIHTSSKLLLSIINDILDLTKVEAGKLEIVPRLYNTAELISDAVQLNLMYMHARPLSFKLHVDSDIPATLMGDELRLKQILNNLLSNAFKYTLNGGVRLSFAYTGGRDLEIEVADTGQGMTEEEVNTLFIKEFTRYNIERNYRVEGSGLGMNITHSLVTMMDGTIDVASIPGMGTTFTVRVPQRAGGTALLGAAAAEKLQSLEAISIAKELNAAEIIPMPYGRVLVVDDIDVNLYVMQGMLAPYGITVETAASGEDAVKKIKAGNRYDIIFMDYMMPGMDGIEAIGAIRAYNYDGCIIALTATVMIGSAQIFMNKGFDGFVSKPISSKSLNEFLMKFVYRPNL